jgi:protease-4
MRLILWVLFVPFRTGAWALRRLYVWLWGYTVLRIRVHGRLPDRLGPGSLFAALSGEPPGPALLDLVLALDRAARDPRLSALLVDLGPLGIGLGRAEELRAALGRVRDAGKRVVVFTEEASLPAYFVALGASEIALPPGGSLNVTGVASEVILLKGLLDRVGVRAWMRARGKYKSARETFAESEMSAESREMTTAIVGDLHDQLVLAISSARKLDPSEVRARLDRGPFVAAEAKALGLIDTVAYADEVESALEAEVGKWRPLGLAAYLRLSTHLVKRGRPIRVGLIEVTGHIKSGQSAPGRDGARATGSRRFVKDVTALAEDPRVRAIVLRVDSPGGSALASDLMWRALAKAQEAKPVVVSMADVAASGGYFVAGIRGAPILASPATITGSIGVLTGKFELSLLYEKLGIKKEIVSVGRRAAFFSEARGFSEDELAKLEADLETHYQHFLARMAEGRGKTVEEIHAVAQGRVWTGRQALANGLIDAHGGLIEAFGRVRALLEVDPRAPLAIVSPATGGRRLPFRLVWQSPESMLPEVLLRPLRLAEDLAGERALVLLPFDIRFE